MHVPHVAFATAAFVGIVGPDFAVAPVGSGAHTGVALFVRHPVE